MASASNGPTEAEWNAQKGFIRNLYLNKEVTQAQLRNELERHGLIATLVSWILGLELIFTV